MKPDRAPNSIDTLSPNNRFIREINRLPIAPGVTYHSIMGACGKGKTPDSNDGVVPCWSVYQDATASAKKIAPSGHSAYEHPEGIEEVPGFSIRIWNKPADIHRQVHYQTPPLCFTGRLDRFCPALPAT